MEVLENALGQETTQTGRLATGLATAVADAEGGGAVTFDRRELETELRVIGAAIEADDGARALDRLATLLASLASAR